MHEAGTNAAVVGGAAVVSGTAVVPGAAVVSGAGVVAGAAVASGAAVVNGAVGSDSEPVALSVSRRKRRYTRAKMSTMTTTTTATICTVLGLELVDDCWFRLASDGGGCGWSLMGRHILVQGEFAGEPTPWDFTAFMKRRPDVEPPARGSSRIEHTGGAGAAAAGVSTAANRSPTRTQQRTRHQPSRTRTHRDLRWRSGLSRRDGRMPAPSPPSDPARAPWHDRPRGARLRRWPSDKHRVRPHHTTRCGS